jgi:hypothetical protein
MGEHTYKIKRRDSCKEKPKLTTKGYKGITKKKKKNIAFQVFRKIAQKIQQ